jgi:steroid delta-isomerase-like uncharacterized protein
MSTGNKQLVRRWFDEVWNQQKPDAITRLMAGDAVAHTLSNPPITGPQQFIEYQKAFLGAFADLKMVVDDLIEEEDTVVARWRAIGTLTGHGIGLTPTGKRMEIMGITIVRVHNGQITEGWDCYDTLGMHQQLGTLNQLPI